MNLDCSEESEQFLGKALLIYEKNIAILPGKGHFPGKMPVPLQPVFGLVLTSCSRRYKESVTTRGENWEQKSL